MSWAAERMPAAEAISFFYEHCWPEKAGDHANRNGAVPARRQLLAKRSVIGGGVQ
jgi:hypothetical protein